MYSTPLLLEHIFGKKNTQNDVSKLYIFKSIFFRFNKVASRDEKLEHGATNLRLHLHDLVYFPLFLQYHISIHQVLEKEIKENKEKKLTPCSISPVLFPIIFPPCLHHVYLDTFPSRLLPTYSACTSSSELNIDISIGWTIFIGFAKQKNLLPFICEAISPSSSSQICVHRTNFQLLLESSYVHT